MIFEPLDIFEIHYVNQAGCQAGNTRLQSLTERLYPKDWVVNALETIATFPQDPHGNAVGYLSSRAPWKSDKSWHAPGSSFEYNACYESPYQLPSGFPWHLPPFRVLRCSDIFWEIIRVDSSRKPDENEVQICLRKNPPDLTSLGLNGSLQWLAEFAQPTEPMETEHRRRYEIKEEMLLSLEISTHALGLKLPEAFRNFMKNSRAQELCLRSTEYDLCVDTLLPCPEEWDNEAGGYVCRFLFSPPPEFSLYLKGEDSSIYLYLGLSGCNAVICTDEDLYVGVDETQGEYHGHNGVYLLGLSFEDFIAIQFFEAELRPKMFGPDIPEGVKKYIDAAYCPVGNDILHSLPDW